MMSEPAAFQRRVLDGPADHIILLHDATWADFQRLLEIRGERPVPRVTYLEGALQLMTPSRTHESLKSMIGCLVEAWCFETSVAISPYGAWLLESKADDRGVEPDECYVVGDDADPQRPDLAIEVIWTSGGINKLEVYRKLGVKEVWIWKEGRIDLFSLRDDHYVPIERSEVLTGIDLPLLLQFVDIVPMTRAVTEFRAAVSRAS
jgi:Uma2 family endonuclease